MYIHIHVYIYIYIMLIYSYTKSKYFDVHIHIYVYIYLHVYQKWRPNAKYNLTSGVTSKELACFEYDEIARVFRYLGPNDKVHLVSSIREHDALLRESAHSSLLRWECVLRLSRRTAAATAQIYSKFDVVSTLVSPLCIYLCVCICVLYLCVRVCVFMYAACA